MNDIPEYIHYDVGCYECTKKFSQKWPANLGDDGESMFTRAEQTLKGNGWRRGWFGGWRCPACRSIAAKANAKRAPWVYAAGVALALVATALLIKGV